MQEQGQGDFEVLLEKLMSYQVERVCWSQNMDLLALLTNDNRLELIRISYKAQKVFEIEEKQTITSIVFSPDSFLLVYGCMDGSIKMLKTENAEKVLVSEKYHQSSVDTINWVSYHTLRTDKFTPFLKDSIQSRLILSVSPHVNCDRNSIAKLKYLSNIKNEFTLLLSSERNKTYLNLNGFVPILSLDYKELGLDDFSVVYSTYRDKIYSLIGYQKMDNLDLHLVTYDCQELSVMKEDVIKINYLIAYVGELFSFAQNSYQAIGNQVRQIMGQYNNKINLLDSSAGDITVNPAEELFKFLNTGVTTQPLTQFITKQLYDTKFLQKLDEGLTTLFGNVQDLALESTQNVLERLTILLKRLINICSVTKYQIFGLSVQKLKEFENQIKQLYSMGELLLNVSTETKFDIRNFLVWLNKITIKSQQSETETENIKSYLNKYTVDVNRLRQFLRDEARFRLKNLQYILTGKWDIKPFNDKFKVEDNSDKSKAQLSQFCVEQRKANFDLILYELGLNNIQVPKDDQKMHVQHQKRNINEIVRNAKQLWNQIAKMPSENMNKLAVKKFSTQLIGQVKSSEDFEPIIRVYDRKNEMTIYYVQQLEGKTVLVKYDCLSKRKRTVKSPPGYTIMDIAVSNSTLVLLQEGNNILVGLLSEDSFESGEMVLEKRLSMNANECRVDSSDKGLSSLLVDKNKLIIKFTINKDNCPLLVESFAPDSANSPEVNRRLVDLLLGTETTVLRENFDMLFEYILYLLAKDTFPYEDFNRAFLFKLLDSQSKKYTLMMVCDRLTSEQLPEPVKYLLHLYSWRYLMMPNANVLIATIQSCIEKGIMIAEALLQDYKTDKSKNQEIVAAQNSEFTRQALTAVSQPQLSKQNAMSIINIVCSNISEWMTIPDSKEALLAVCKNKNIWIQDFSTNKTPISIFQLIYFSPSVQYLYSPQAKFDFVLGSFNLGAQSPALISQFSKLTKTINFSGVKFRNHRLDQIIYKILDFMGTNMEAPAESITKALQSMRISDRDGLLLWKLIMERTEVHNFKAYCLGRYKSYLTHLMDKQRYASRTWGILESICKSLTELSPQSGDLLGEIINLTIMLKLRLKKQIPITMKQQLVRIQQLVATKEQLNQNPSINIAMFRLQQYLK